MVSVLAEACEGWSGCVWDRSSHLHVDLHLYGAFSAKRGNANSSPSNLRLEGSRRSLQQGKHRVTILSTEQSMRMSNMQPKVNNIPFPPSTPKDPGLFLGRVEMLLTCCHFVFLLEDWLLSPNPNAHSFPRNDLFLWLDSQTLINHFWLHFSLSLRAHS